MAEFSIESLRGGSDDFTPPSHLPKDLVQLAENVEFFYSTLGERRLGTATVTELPVGITGNFNFGYVAWMFRHEPTTNPLEAELWVMTVDTGDVNPRMFRFSFTSGWDEILWASAGDEPVVTSGFAYRVYGASLHGKLFLAYFAVSSNRLHVYAPETSTTTIRPAGISDMDVPASVADGGGAGAYPADPRYYRTRGIVSQGGIVYVRGEPSPSFGPFTPSGANANATITRGNFNDSFETHWEVEASEDGTTFYRIATVVAATTTYADTTLVADYVNFPQSDPLLSYTLIRSVEYLAVDNDRLLTAGAHDNLGFTSAGTGDKSAILWTPVGTDPLPGPDERLNGNTNPRIDLDSGQGGNLTAISAGVTGVVYAFKRQHTYKLHRTGQLVGSYEAELVTTERGAVSRSLVEAHDESGQPTLYFIDPRIGPMRAGASSLQWVGHGVTRMWQRVNTSAIVACHGLFYPSKQQVHYWVAYSSTDAVDYPTAKMVLQLNEVESTSRGGRRGWATVPESGTGGIAYARCSALFYDPTSSVPSTGIGNLRPLIGRTVFTNAIEVCDTGTDDNGIAYTGRIRTRPYFLASILNRYGFLAAAVLGLADTHVRVNARRDFGTETLSFDADFTAPGSEEYVIAHLDEMTMAELFALEIEFTDDPDHIDSWRLLQFALKPSMEQTA